MLRDTMHVGLLFLYLIVLKSEESVTCRERWVTSSIGASKRIYSFSLVQVYTCTPVQVYTFTCSQWTVLTLNRNQCAVIFLSRDKITGKIGLYSEYKAMKFLRLLNSTNKDFHIPYISASGYLTATEYWMLLAACLGVGRTHMFVFSA